MPKEYKILINGKRLKTGSALDVVNPYDGSIVGRTFLAGEEELEGAVESAVAVFEKLKQMPAYERADVIAKVAAGISDRAEELAETITKEAGKPILDARAEVARGENTFRLAAEESKRLPGELLPLDIIKGAEKRLGIVRRFPVGPVLGISPFNFPLNLVAHKVAPAMATGNPIIIKPASKTPLTALILGEIVTRAGWPAGGLNVCPCPGKSAEKLFADDRIKKLTFTGSAPVGWRLKSLAGMKKVTLELGGNAGVIVHDDADIEFAVARSIIGAFSYAGQICISVQRIYVQKNVFSQFRDAFLGLAGALKMGDPLDETTQVGPMIDAEAPRRARQWVEEAVKDGAKLLIGGKSLTGGKSLAGGKCDDNFFEPTVLTDTKPGMKVCGEEVFAPLVTLEPYERFADALAEVNRSRFGLQAGVFTRDIQRVHEAFERLEVGGVVANDIPTFRVDSMPYGGVKASGFGREGVRWAMEEMTEPKLLVINLDSPPPPGLDP